MSKTNVTDVIDFITNNSGSDVKNIIEGLRRVDLTYMLGAIDREINKRDSEGLVPLLVITNGGFNVKFYNMDDLDEAVKYLRSLIIEDIDRQANKSKGMIGYNLNISSSHSIQIVKVNADEVDYYLELCGLKVEQYES